MRTSQRRSYACAGTFDVRAISFLLFGPSDCLVECTKRKVKCDKRQPYCSACSRSSLPCRYRSSPPSQRRKRKAFSALTESTSSNRHEYHSHAQHSQSSQNGLNQVLLDRLRAHETTMRSAGIQFPSYTSDLGHYQVRETHPHDLEDGQDIGQDNEENDADAQASVEQQRHISNRSAMATHMKASVSRSHASRYHRGTLIPEYGGKRYYDHGFIGVMGQEVSKIYNAYKVICCLFLV